MQIGDMTPDEENFVLASIKKSMRNSAEYREYGDGVAYAHLNPHVNDLVGRSAVLVARDRGRILGFSVFEVDGDQLLLHYIYTRFAARRQGVARSILAATIENSPGAELVLYTTPTSRFERLAERYGLEPVEGES